MGEFREIFWGTFLKNVFLELIAVGEFKWLHVS